MSNTTAPQWLTDIMEKESFLAYHAYYKVVRHNHKAHGMGALALIGASEERVKKYADIFNKNGLIPMDGDESKNLDFEKDFIKSDNIDDYIGKNQAFYKILSHFTKLYKEKYNEDYHALIRGEVPALSDGPILAAFHGVIQTAYGIAGNSPQVVLEGVSTYFQQYSPFLLDEPTNPKRNDLSRFGNGKTDLLDVLEKLRTTPGLVEQMDHDNAKDRQYRKDNHYFGVYGWGTWKYHSERFLDLTDDIKLPDWFDSTKQEESQLIKLNDWCFDMATILFVKSEVINDFFILHGITGAWSQKKVLPYLDYISGLRSIRAYLCAVLMVYVNQGCPELNKNPEDFWKGSVNEAAWDKFIKETIAEDYETHVYKVIQCCYDRWKENPHTEYSAYLMAAAEISRSHNFGRGKQQPGETFPNSLANM